MAVWEARESWAGAAEPDGLTFVTGFDFADQPAVDIQAGGDGAYAVRSVGGSSVSSANMTITNIANATALDIGASNGLESTQSGTGGTQAAFTLSDLGTFTDYDQIVVLAQYAGSISGADARLVLKYRAADGDDEAHNQRRWSGSALMRYIEKKDATVSTNNSGNVDATAHTVLGLRCFRSEFIPLYGAWVDPYPAVGDLSEDDRIAFTAGIGNAWPFSRATDTIQLVFQQGAANAASFKKLYVFKARGV